MASSNSFAKSRPPASASSSIFNVFSPPSQSSEYSIPSTSNTTSPASSIASLFTESKSELADNGSSSNGSSSNGNDDTSTSFAGYIVRFILIVLLLGFAGFNVFKEMGLITDDIFEFIRPVSDFISNLLANVSKQFVSTTSEGTRTGIDIVSGAAKSGVNIIEDQVTGKGILAPVSDSDEASIVTVQSSGGGTAKQEAARARALTMKTGSQPIDLPQPDDSLSVTQKGKTSGKSGYCFVGEDRGHRSCIYVNESDTCMSGNIFPSKDKCINPSLRV